jgi:hypothetical protein
VKACKLPFFIPVKEAVEFFLFIAFSKLIKEEIPLIPATPGKGIPWLQTETKKLELANIEAKIGRKVSNEIDDPVYHDALLILVCLNPTVL